MTNIISPESAEAQVQLLLDWYDLRPDEVRTETQSVIETSIRRLVRAVQEGHVEIRETTDGKIDVMQRLIKPPSKTDTLTYGVLTGKAKVTLRDTDSSYERIYGILGSLAGVGRQVIASLEGRDLTIAESLGFLYLAA